MCQLSTVDFVGGSGGKTVGSIAPEVTGGQDSLGFPGPGAIAEEEETTGSSLLMREEGRTRGCSPCSRAQLVKGTPPATGSSAEIRQDGLCFFFPLF